MNEEKKSLWFQITKQDQYFAVNDLILESQENANYYISLILSSVIIAAGLLLANSAVVIGGMLITPLLTPILSVGLGLTIGNIKLIKGSAMVILKSIATVFAISLIAALIFSVPEDKEFFSSALFNNRIEAAFLYFLVALVSGLAATYAWIRKKVDNTLPGISIAVSLVPPISLVAIWLGSGEFDLMRFFLMVFLFNVMGIIGGSMILFSMFKFYRSEGQIHQTVNQIENNNKVEKIQTHDEFTQ